MIPSGGDFWAPQSLEELAESQGTSPIERIEDLQIKDISEEEANAFLTALGL
ncbi:MAG: hypothetical protein OXN44_10710 [Acidimicrobiaceae bacterium]|nr:hypothetical protein [Acidimicrobiaceae bacterium]